jgi:hypothetical protein
MSELLSIVMTLVCAYSFAIVVLAVWNRLNIGKWLPLEVVPPMIVVTAIGGTVYAATNPVSGQLRTILWDFAFTAISAVGVLPLTYLEKRGAVNKSAKYVVPVVATCIMSLLTAVWFTFSAATHIIVNIYYYFI